MDGNRPLRLDDDVAVLDMDRECLGYIGPFGQRLAILDHDRIGSDLDALGVEPGLAVAHVELPAVPGAAEQFPDPRALIDTGLLRRQPRHAGSLLQRRAGVRTAIEQRKVFAVDMKHDDVAAVDFDNLVAAGRNLRRPRDDVPGHVVSTLIRTWRLRACWC